MMVVKNPFGGSKFVVFHKLPYRSMAAGSQPIIAYSPKGTLDRDSVR